MAFWITDRKALGETIWRWTEMRKVNWSWYRQYGRRATVRTDMVDWNKAGLTRAVGDAGCRMGWSPPRPGLLVRGWLSGSWAVVDEDGVPRDRKVNRQLLLQHAALGLARD